MKMQSNNKRERATTDTIYVTIPDAFLKPNQTSKIVHFTKITKGHKVWRLENSRKLENFSLVHLYYFTW